VCAERGLPAAPHLSLYLSPGQAARWGSGEEGAAARADANDVLNMQRVAPTARLADLRIESL